MFELFDRAADVRITAGNLPIGTNPASRISSLFGPTILFLPKSRRRGTVVETNGCVATTLTRRLNGLQHCDDCLRIDSANFTAHFPENSWNTSIRDMGHVT